MATFSPTHIIIRSENHILVQADLRADGCGPLYTRKEWESASPADWTLERIPSDFLSDVTVPTVHFQGKLNPDVQGFVSLTEDASGNKLSESDRTDLLRRHGF